MIVCPNFNYNYSGDPIRFLGLEKFADSNDNIILAYGLGHNHAVYLKGLYYIDLELPILGPKNVLDYHYACDKVIMLCPYTAKWLNDRFNTKKFVSSFFPLDTSYIVSLDKRFDVIYTGQLNSKEIYETVREMSSFNYCHVAFGGDFATHC